MSENKTVWTIGYEGREIEDLVAQLRKASVDTLVDVRIRAGSRKRGMSKTALSEHLAAAGIAYVHIRSLGTPRDMLARVRETGVYDWEGYRAHMLEQSDALEQLVAVATDKRSSLFCYEADVEECHRKVLAEYLVETCGMAVINL